MKKELDARGYNWATLSIGEMNSVIWPSRMGVGGRLTTIHCRKITVAKSKELKTG
jgi:hypothetical protein